MELSGIASRRKEFLLFRYLDYYHLPFVLWYLLRGYTLTYLDTRPGIAAIFRWTGSSRGDRIRHLKWGDFDFYSQAALNNTVLDSIDDLYAGILEHQPFMRQMEHFLGSPLVHAVYKKILALEICDLCRFYFASDMLKRTYGAVNPLVVPSVNLGDWHGIASTTQRLLDLPPVTVPPWARVMNTLVYHLSLLKWLLFYAFFPLWLLLQVRVPGSEAGTPRHFHLGLRVYGTDMGFRYRYRSIDFLLRNGSIDAQDALFCLETDLSPEYRQRLIEKNYHIVDMRSILRHVPVRFIQSILFGEVIPHWRQVFPALIHQPPVVIRMTMEIFSKYAAWMAFLDKYRVKHYVVYNDITPGSIVRNLLLGKKGGTTWFYVHSVHTYNEFTPEGKPPVREILFSFLFYDHLAVWGRRIEQYFRSCPNFVAEYTPVGCLWSEHVVHAGRNRETNEILSRTTRKFSMLPGGPPEKILGVFDTTIGETAPLQSPDMIGFLNGIVNLLEDFPEIGIIFKNKNPLDYIEAQHPELSRPYRDLMNHPRCILTGDLNPDPADTIAASDLIISACFTSTTVEALGARKRSLYYDASDRFSGTYYDRFPDLVAHSYDQLRSLVRHWLYGTTDEEFTRYLDKYIRGELDFHLDGCAITRLRTLLASTPPAPVQNRSR